MMKRHAALGTSLATRAVRRTQARAWLSAGRWGGDAASPGGPLHGGPRIQLQTLSTNTGAANCGVTGSERGRRVLNIGVALIGIVVTAPLMLVIAVLVALESRGPVIYTQSRVGLDRRGRRGPESLNRRRSSDVGGRIFTIYKFRTMTADSSSAAEQWATKSDTRITRIGGFLRTSRCDELPQLFNVLKGDMNIVGPRPEQPKIFAELRTELNGYHERQKVLPGITGLAQVTLGYDTSIDDVKKKVDMDLEYIRQRSATSDLGIMAKTMPVMLFGKVWM
jgi:lipopolysaccharide/colanic/teichoic acid biosynthesis glycosyltransferase